MQNKFDIDIDVNSLCDKSKYGIRGMIYNVETERVNPHPSCYYIEDVPLDLLTGNAAIDYEYAEEKGFKKIDLLTNTSYDVFKNKEEILQCVDMEPKWDLLLEEDFVKKLPHISKHFDLIEKTKPKSVEDLADVLALIRPGKIHLIDDYINNKDLIRKELYKRPKKGAYFKKAHAISYAVMIVCIMNKKTNSLFGW